MKRLNRVRKKVSHLKCFQFREYPQFVGVVLEPKDYKARFALYRKTESGYELQGKFWKSKRMYQRCWSLSGSSSNG